MKTFIGRSLKMTRHERDHSLAGRPKDFSVLGANHRQPSRPNRNKFGADYTVRVTVHVKGRGQARVPKSPRSLLTHSCFLFETSILPNTNTLRGCNDKYEFPLILNISISNSISNVDFFRKTIYVKGNKIL